MDASLTTSGSKMKTRSKSRAFKEKAEKRRSLRGDSVLPRNYFPHRLDEDYYSKCEELGLCEDCGLVDLCFATDEDDQRFLCRCKEVDKYISDGYRHLKDSLK